MKLTNSTILNSTNGLNSISQKQLPVKVSYAIAKNLAKLESEIKVYNSERNKLIELYADKDGEGKVIHKDNGQVTFTGTGLEGWIKDIALLDAEECEVDIHTFKIELLEGYDVSALELIAIDYMIEA